MRDYPWREMKLSRITLGKIAFACALFLWSAAAAQPARDSGATVKGRIAAIKNDGSFLCPESARVYLIFNTGMDDRRRGFAHRYYEDTAGRIYIEGYNKAIKPFAKEFEALKKLEKEGSTRDRADQLAKYYLSSVDDGLAASVEWTARKSNRAWQIRASTPDAQGYWSIEGLPSGSYLIVARGTIAGYQAVWEADSDLEPERPVSLKLHSPLYLRRTK